MTLHHINVVDEVLDEYRSYVLAEFRARDEGLRLALDTALEERGFLAQEPFFHRSRPRRRRAGGRDSAGLGSGGELSTAVILRPPGEPGGLALCQGETWQV